MVLPESTSATPAAGDRRGRPVLRLLALADLAPGREAGPLAVAAGAAGVDAALAEIAPALAFAVPDRLGTGAKELDVALRFTRLDDFHPEALARAVPVLAGLAAARGLLEACQRGEIEPAEAARRLPEALGPHVPLSTPLRPQEKREEAVSSPLDSLLSQVELPSGAGAAPLRERPLAGLLAGPFDRGALSEVIAELDRRIGRQVAEIAGAERLRELEAAWRGVRLLAGRAGETVRLEVLAAGRDSFLDAFFDAVFEAEHEGAAEVPLAAVVLGWEMDRGPADLETLRNLARIGESLRVPFLGAVGPAFWGIRQAKLLANLPDLTRKAEGSEYAKWNGLRREEISLWLCLAANRFALRDAWTGEGDPLWGSGAWALGAILAQAFAAGGVRFPMAGLPAAAPLEVALSDQKALEIARVGLAPLLVRRGETEAHFSALPSVHLPKRYDREEATHSAWAVATLPFQAFAGVAAHELQVLAREMGAGLAAEEVKRRFEEGMLAFLAGAEEAPGPEEAQVEVQSPPDAPDVWEVLVRLRPRFEISGAAVDLVLGSFVPR